MSKDENKSTSSSSEEGKHIKLDAKLTCGCKSSEHVAAMSVKDQDAECDSRNLHARDAAVTRELEAHTAAYLTAYDTEFMRLVEIEAADVDIDMEAWVLANHDRLCCMHRHRNAQLATVEDKF